MTETIIPKSWKQEKLGKVTEFRNGKGHEKNIVNNGRYIVVNSKFISSDGKVRKFSNDHLSPLYKDDVVMVMSDVPNGKAIAKCFLIPVDNKYSLNQRICSITSKTIMSAFLCRALNRNKYFLSFDDGAKQTNLRKNDILACPIIYPPLPEQEKIVEVLETWDDCLEKLTKTIKAKKKIKKGLMQKMLTGKVRLPGFSEKWEEKELREICTINPKNNNLPDQFIYIDLDSVEKGTLKKEKTIKLSKAPSRAQRKLQRGDILFQMVRPYQKNNLLFEKTGDYVASTGYAQIRTQENTEFIYYTLHTDTFVNKVLAKCTGSNYPAINSTDLAKIQIARPTLEEQTAISNILEAADQEIEALEKKKDLIEKQKKFLLNNLITGKIQLPEFIK